MAQTLGSDGGTTCGGEGGASCARKPRVITRQEMVRGANANVRLQTGARHAVVCSRAGAAGACCYIWAPFQPLKWHNLLEAPRVTVASKRRETSGSRQRSGACLCAALADSVERRNSGAIEGIETGAWPLAPRRVCDVASTQNKCARAAHREKDVHGNLLVTGITCLIVRVATGAPSRASGRAERPQQRQR